VIRPGETIDPGRLGRLIATLPADLVAAQRWFGAKKRGIVRLELHDAAPLPGRAGEPEAALLVLEVRYADGGSERYLMPLVRAPDEEANDPSQLRVPDENGKTLMREPRDGDGVGRRVIEAIAAGAPLRGLHGVFEGEAGSALTTLLPTSALTDTRLPERCLRIDQTNTSLIVGERVVVKVFRKLEPGINPDIELGRFLTERDFNETPAFAGSIRYVDASGVACSAGLVQAYVADGADGWAASVAELRGWLAAPAGTILMEAATAEGARLGTITARLHAALAGGRDERDFAPRWASPATTREWRRAAERQLDDALALLGGQARDEVAALVPRIRAHFAAFENATAPPILIRVHGDYHLGQVLRSGKRRWVVDFEGAPTRSLVERRQRQSPLSDVASMLRSFDHVARQALRETGGGPGLDLEEWLLGSRRRFLAAYRAELARHATPIAVDPGLLRAFEFEKGCYELTYEARYMPDWLWMPLASLRALVSTG